MAMTWTDRAPLRPDRYLDWALVDRTTREDVRDEWCSVLIQMWAIPGAAPAANLLRLQGEMPGMLSTGAPTLNAMTDERGYLARRIHQLETGTLQPTGDDDPRLTFFVYMPESRAYTAQGQFNHIAGYYKIRLVGPPIPDLRFGQRSADSARLATTIGPREKQSVAIGVIDHAIAFANERFRKRHPGAVDTTRVRRIWLQTIEKSDDDMSKIVLFGRRLKDTTINQLFNASAGPSHVIDEDSVYALSGAVDFKMPNQQAIARRVGHGTHVMDLACGYAPNEDAGDTRPIFAVQLPEPATLDTSGVTLASYALQGLRQIMLWADEITPERPLPLPLVINFSYGFYAGPKDGHHVLEHEMRRLIDSRNSATRTVLVVPAGNTYRARVTARMSLAPNTGKDIDWIVHPDCGTSSFLEIWMDGSGTTAPVNVQIGPPGAPPTAISMPAVGQAKTLMREGKPIGALYFDAATSRPIGAPARSRLLIAINPTKAYKPGRVVAPSGRWAVRLDNASNHKVEAHLYIQRQERPPGEEPPGRQSYFDGKHADDFDPETGNYDGLGSACPIVHAGSLTAIATDPTTIVVGAAFAKKDGSASHKPSLYSSAGPTPSRAAPDFAAIADEDRAYLGILAAGTRSGSVVAIDGTSVAAPQVTRALADAGLDIEKMKIALGVTASTVSDARLGKAVVPMVTRDDIKARRRT